MTTITTSAKTPEGIGRAYVRQHGCRFDIGGGRYAEAKRGVHAIHLDGDPEGTVSVLAFSGTARAPRGAVVLARGVHIARPISKNTLDLLSSMLGGTNTQDGWTGLDGDGVVTNPHFHGFEGRRVQRAAAIRAGWIKVRQDQYGRDEWTVTALGRRMATQPQL